jgi:hypothetical protein
LTLLIIVAQPGDHSEKPNPHEQKNKPFVSQIMHHAAEILTTSLCLSFKNFLKYEKRFISLSHPKKLKYSS